MDEINHVFNEFQVKFTTDAAFADAEWARIRRLANWKSMTQEQLADEADYVAQKIMSEGSGAARQELLEQMQIAAGTVNATAVANCARVTLSMNQPEQWARFMRCVTSGAIKIRDV